MCNVEQHTLLAKQHDPDAGFDSSEAYRIVRSRKGAQSAHDAVLIISRGHVALNGSYRDIRAATLRDTAEPGRACHQRVELRDVPQYVWTDDTFPQNTGLSGCGMNPLRGLLRVHTRSSLYPRPIPRPGGAIEVGTGRAQDKRRGDPRVGFIVTNLTWWAGDGGEVL